MQFRLAIVLFIISSGKLLSQSMPDSTPRIGLLDMNPRLVRYNDTSWIRSGICKTLKISKVPLALMSPGQRGNKISFLKINGNIQYDFLYRSFADTPFYQKDFRQHTIKTNFNLLFKNSYPVQLTVLHRNSNSPYFRDITDVSVQFRHKDYLNKIRENLHNLAVRSVNTGYQAILQKTERYYNAKLSEVSELQQWLASPARIQEIISEKEILLKNNHSFIPDTLLSSTLAKLSVPGLSEKIELPDEELIKEAIRNKLASKINPVSDSILRSVENWIQQKTKRIADSIANTKTSAFIEIKKKELEKMKDELFQLEKNLKGLRKNIADSLSLLKREITRLKDPVAIQEFIQRKNIRAKELPKGWKSLMAIESVGIGRNWVDYTELTVKNISLTGINVETNPGNIYLAFAAGRINYRFRDFVVDKNNQPRQSLYLLRAGVGKKEGNNFIISWYDGQRNLLNPFTSVPSNISAERVIGISAETRLRISDNQYISAEFGKSSFHNTGTINSGSSSLLQKVKNFKDRSNEAYCIKLNSYWPDAGIKLSGYYKKMGEHFQSFNLQPVNSIQEAFHLKWQQQLWNKKLTIDAAIRKNDFSNPFISQGISSRTLFKSLQLSIRVPKYPYLTVGFAPSSQLTVVDNQRLEENQYNTLNALLSYSYSVKDIRMVSNAMYLKFYNNSPDTGFIYYNASSFSLTQLFYMKSIELQSGLTITAQEGLNVLTIEQSLTYQLKQWLSLGGGVKYNRINNSKTQWGATTALNMVVNKIGTIQMSYDKSFLPGTNRNLLPVHTGRLSLFRSF